MQKIINKIICGDCVAVLKKIKEPFADLIFADPPFNIGYKYDRYRDNHKREHYIDWTEKWMAECYRVLKPTGSFYIAIGDDYAANVKIIADKLGLIMRNWIIWHYTFGQQTKTKFARSHTHIFYFIKDDKNFIFNDYAVRVPSDRQLIYDDKRANSKGKMPDDVWNTYPRVCGTFKERTRWHPCQMPETLLARIITTSSAPGELVFDPFSGSGTTAAAAARFGRNYFGIDLSETYVEKSIQRLKTLKKENNFKQTNLFDSIEMNSIEINELKRLMSDMDTDAKNITEDQKLLTVFASQLAIRTDSGKKCPPEDIKTVLKELVR